MVHQWCWILHLRQGSNALDSSAAPARSSPVMLSAAKHLAAARDRPFAEFPLSAAHGLRVTLCDCSNGQGQFVQIEPCLKIFYCILDGVSASAASINAGSISFVSAWTWYRLSAQGISW